MNRKQLAKGFKFWRQKDVATTREVIKMYRDGFAGAYSEPEVEEELMASLPFPSGGQVAYDFGLVGTGQGELSLPYLFAWNNWPKCWPCPGQKTGDCTAHGGKNVGIVLIGVEAGLGEPDEETGLVEGFPEVSDLGEREGVVACENIYGDRGHSGQGASCSRLQSYVISKGGLMLRKDYPELGIDLEEYDVNLSIGWGRNGTPSKINKFAQDHQIRTATRTSTEEVNRDFIANGYPIWSCSSLGWSSRRDENGYSRQSGSWSHSWIVMGYDDRKGTIDHYGFPLALYNHDWSRWNGGGRRIRDSRSLAAPLAGKLGTTIAELKRRGIVDSEGYILIPEGSMWIDARLLRQCDTKAMSSLEGWKARPKVIDWSTGWS